MSELGSAVFLPWVRGALTADAASPDAGTLPRLSASIAVTLSSGAGDEPVSAPFDLYGPADVSGLSNAQVLRTDPKPGEPAAEPNYLCLIEFDAPELPWALSPTAPDGKQQVQPWIALVVVEDVPGRIQQRSGVSLPLLRCPAALLPPCTESWAWAHAQVVPVDGRSVDELLVDPAAGGSTLSRLVCPTKLEPETRYVACVVPTYAAGVVAQLGGDLAGVGLTPAWGESGEAVLPVYFSWRFTTAVAGDFEDAARLLHPVQADSIPGLGRSALAVAAGAIIDIPAGEVPALRTLLTTVTEVDLMVGETVPDAVQAPLAAAVSPDAVPADPPTVQPPAYGRWPAQIDHIDTTTAGWIGDLNRSPAHRVVARLGADLVRAQQEELVAEARRQAGEYVRARAARDRLRLAELTATRLTVRRLTELDAPRLIAAARPAHGEVALPDGRSVAAGLAGSVTDPAVLGRAMARVTERAARQMQVGARAVRAEMVAGAFDGSFTARPVAVPVLTDQVDRLRDVYARAGLLDREVGTTTLGRLIDASPMVAEAQTRLGDALATAPLVFEEAIPPVVEPGGIEPGLIEPVGPGDVDVVVEPGLFEPHHIEPHHIEPGHIDPGGIGGLSPIRLQGFVGGDAAELVAAHIARPRLVSRVDGAFRHVDASVFTEVLDEQSTRSVVGMLGDAVAPVATELGIEPGVVDVNAFAVDRATADVGRRFREQVTGDADAASPIAATALLRASLGLEVATPLRRDTLTPDAQSAFDRAIDAVATTVLTPIHSFPAGSVSRFVADDVAAACRVGLAPRTTHTVATSRVLTRDRAGIIASALELTFGFVPTFDAPLASRLGRSLNAWILAGSGELPSHAVTLLATNPAFIEAFTAGANHELAAELLWRDVLDDPRGTAFTRFWASSPIPPIHRWRGALGRNADDGRSLVAVVIRSPLLRRYPNTVIYAAKRLADGQRGFTPDPATIREVKYTGFIEPDASYSVIDLDVADARDEQAGWYVLISQPVTDARFGLDEWTGTTAPPPPDQWDDLNWGHVANHRLTPSTAPVLPATTGGVVWGESAAHMAVALHQDPFRVVLPAAHYLP